MYLNPAIAFPLATVRVIDNPTVLAQLTPFSQHFYTVWSFRDTSSKLFPLILFIPTIVYITFLN